MKELQAFFGLKAKITTKFNYELTLSPRKRGTRNEKWIPAPSTALRTSCAGMTLLVQIRENSWQKTGHRLKLKFPGSLVGTGAIADAYYGIEDIQKNGQICLKTEITLKGMLKNYGK